MPTKQSGVTPEARRRVGLLIAQKMAAKGISPEAMAKRLGKKSGGTVRGYMAGTYSPPLDTMVLLCIELGISGDLLMSTAGFPMVPDEAAEIDGLVKRLLRIRAENPTAFEGIEQLSRGLTQER